MKKSISMFTILLIMTIPVSFLAAGEAEALMERIDSKQKTDTSWTRMTMRIVPADGGTVREFRVESYGRGESDSYMVFLEPGSIRGLRILELGNDTRVYFPSTGRIRRITGDGKSGSAGGVGGDFSYEDIGSGSYVEDYRLSMDGEEAGTWIVRGIPADPDSSYTHLLFYVDKRNERVVRTEYFTAEEGHKKSLLYDDYRTVQGVDMPFRMEMTNHLDRQKTIITIEEARYNMGIDEKYFNPNRFYR